MRKMICLFLCLLFCLWGCTRQADAPKEPVQFYYPRYVNDFDYSSADGVITHELRESAGHSSDYTYLLNLYLQGPVDQRMRSIFPAATGILSLQLDQGTACLTLTDSFAQLTGMERTLACACLTLTVHGLTGAETVSITTENQLLDQAGEIIMRPDEILFADNSAEAVQD